MIMIEECPICYNDNKLCTLVCKHKMCLLCMYKIANTNKKCPFCRTIVIYKCRICSVCISRKHYNISQCIQYVESLSHSYYIDICNMLSKICVSYIYFTCCNRYRVRVPVIQLICLLMSISSIIYKIIEHCI